MKKTIRDALLYKVLMVLTLIAVITQLTLLALLSLCTHYTVPIYIADRLKRWHLMGSSENNEINVTNSR